MKCKTTYARYIALGTYQLMNIYCWVCIAYYLHSLIVFTHKKT